MKAELVLSYAAAQAAIERLEERLKLSPVRSALRVRTQIAERQALARIDGAPLLEDDILVDGRRSVGTSPFDLSRSRHAVAADIGLDALLQEPRAVIEWLGLPVSEAGGPMMRPEIPLERIMAWQGASAAIAPSPPLLGGAHLARLWRAHAPLGQGDLAASLLIGDRWGPGRWDGSKGGLVAMGLEGNQQPWKVAEGEQLEHVWLEAIRQGAQAHLDLELRLRAYAVRAAQFLQAKRRPGRLKDMLLLAMIRPRVTSSMAAKALGITSAGAIKLLTIAAEAGLLVERSGQASYRHYAIPVAASSEMPRRLADPFDPGEDLNWEPQDLSGISSSVV
jgi:hypothetical protein